MLEKIGQKLLIFIEKIGEFIIALPLWIRVFKNKLFTTLDKAKQIKIYPKAPKIFKPFLDKRWLTVKEYVVLKAQLAIITCLISAMLYTINLVFVEGFFILMILAGGYIIYLVKFEMDIFGRDSKAYKIFFSILILIIGVIVTANQFLFPTILRGFLTPSIILSAIPIVVLALGLILITQFTFKRKFGRDFTYGEIIETLGNFAKVRIGYDLCAGTTPRICFIENPIRALAGDKVKVRVERKFFSIRGAKPIYILEKLNKIE